jgi:hypothetical protein
MFVGTYAWNNIVEEIKLRPSKNSGFIFLSLLVRLAEVIYRVSHRHRTIPVTKSLG